MTDQLLVDIIKNVAINASLAKNTWIYSSDQDASAFSKENKSPLVHLRPLIISGISRRDAIRTFDVTIRFLTQDDMQGKQAQTELCTYEMFDLYNRFMDKMDKFINDLGIVFFNVTGERAITRFKLYSQSMSGWEVRFNVVAGFNCTESDLDPSYALLLQENEFLILQETGSGIIIT